VDVLNEAALRSELAIVAIDPAVSDSAAEYAVCGGEVLRSGVTRTEVLLSDKKTTLWDSRVLERLEHQAVRVVIVYHIC
jgi:hypothetical protein